jgi:hypothetical protein
LSITHVGLGHRLGKWSRRLDPDAVGAKLDANRRTAYLILPMTDCVCDRLSDDNFWESGHLIAARAEKCHVDAELLQHECARVLNLSVDGAVDDVRRS